MVDLSTRATPSSRCCAKGCADRSRLMERVVSAAIQYDGLIFSQPPPARHAHIVRSMQAVGLLKDVHVVREQGFLTSLGRYVSREEGADVARTAGQLVGRTMTGSTRTLYSEDLW